MSKGGGCAVCDGRQIQSGVNDVASTDKHLLTPNTIAYFADVADAYKYTRGSRSKVYFAHIADNGDIHKWLAPVSQVATRKRGCAVCSGSQIQIGVNDVATTDKNFIVENDVAYFENIDDAYKYSRGSNTKVWFRHRAKDGQIHRWFASVKNVVTKGKKCAVCDGRQVQRGINDIATTHPSFTTPNLDAYLENPEDGFKYSRGSTVKVWFLHNTEHGEIHRWLATCGHVVAGDRRCPQCSTGRGERLFCAVLRNQIQKIASEKKLLSRLSEITLPVVGASLHSHKFDFLVHVSQQGGNLRRFGGEYDGGHHFPNNGAPYGFPLRISHEEQREIDLERNTMVDLMVRLPSSHMLNVDFYRLEEIANRLAAAGAKAFFDGACGLMIHPISAPVYSTTYSKETVDGAVAVFKRYDATSTHFIHK